MDERARAGQDLWILVPKTGFEMAFSRGLGAGEPLAAPFILFCFHFRNSSMLSLGSQKKALLWVLSLSLRMADTLSLEQPCAHRDGEKLAKGCSEACVTSYKHSLGSEEQMTSPTNIFPGIRVRLRRGARMPHTGCLTEGHFHR